jgi:N-acetylglucosamine-6-sulfatase
MSAMAVRLKSKAPGKISEKTQRPNIVYVLTDDHSLQTIGAYGWRLSEFCRTHRATPNIDRLAREGALFLNSFCENSICSPSRASILSGLYSHEHGVQRLEEPMKPGVWTFPETLQAAGYATALIGKWHLGNEPQGFDEYAVLHGQGTYWDPKFTTPAGEERTEGYATDIITARAESWLHSRNPEQPFLLMLQHKAPHRPFQPPPRYYRWLEDVFIPEPGNLFDDYAGRSSVLHDQAMEIGRHMQLEWDLRVVPPGTLPPELPARELAAFESAYGDANRVFLANPPSEHALTRWKYQRYVKDYLRCVKAVDDSVGRVLTTLEELGLDSNTVVIYSSDQGFFNGEHGWFDKRWIYEESLNMPLLMRWPGGIAPGQRIRQLVQNIDHAPTLAALAGLAARVPAAVRGRSLLPLLQDAPPADWRDSIYYRYIDSVTDRGHRVALHEGVRTATYLLARFWETDEWELYDLARDPMQMQNLIGDPAFDEVRTQLEQRLTAYRRDLGVPPEEQMLQSPETVKTLR